MQIQEHQAESCHSSGLSFNLIQNGFVLFHFFLRKARKNFFLIKSVPKATIIDSPFPFLKHQANELLKNKIASISDFRRKSESLDSTNNADAASHVVVKIKT